jgi:hypothetical protein
MNWAWTTFVVCVAILDAAIVAERIVFGGSQRELLHGLGAFIAPLYFALAGAWLWIVVRVATALKERRSVEWMRVLVLGTLALLPIFM